MSIVYVVMLARTLAWCTQWSCMWEVHILWTVPPENIQSYGYNVNTLISINVILTWWFNVVLLRIMNDILRLIDSGSIINLTMLDLSAVFATVDDCTLLNRLSVNFGISGRSLMWFSSYLTDRFQSVLVEGNCSSDFNLMYGVPQGSVVGPVLFTMYIC